MVLIFAYNIRGSCRDILKRLLTSSELIQVDGIKIPRSILLVESHEGQISCFLSEEILSIIPHEVSIIIPIYSNKTSSIRENIRQTDNYNLFSLFDINVPKKYFLVYLDASDDRAFNLESLNYLWSRVENGGFLLIDDYVSINFSKIQEIDRWLRSLQERYSVIERTISHALIRKL